MKETVEKAMPEPNKALEYESLNDRQKELAEAYTEIATKFGMFNQSSLGDGAHYAPAKLNPFKATGLMCKNCTFYDENGQCQIVSGTIEPDAICKLWIIEENEIVEKTDTPEESFTKSVWGGRIDPLNAL